MYWWTGQLSDQETDRGDPDSGARALAGFCRPFARHVQGRIRRMRFDRARSEFRLEFDADPSIAAPCEIYVPHVQFPLGIESKFDGGEADIQYDRGTQVLTIHVRTAGPSTLIVSGR